MPEIIQKAIVGDNIPSDEYDSDPSSESENEHNDINIDRLRRNLVKWSHANKICRSAVTSLLKVLRIEKAMQSFPSDARTFLKTPTKAESIPMEHGQYMFILVLSKAYIIL